MSISCRGFFAFGPCWCLERNILIRNQGSIIAVMGMPVVTIITRRDLVTVCISPFPPLRRDRQLITSAPLPLPAVYSLDICGRDGGRYIDEHHLFVCFSALSWFYTARQGRGCRTGCCGEVGDVLSAERKCVSLAFVRTWVGSHDCYAYSKFGSSFDFYFRSR